MGWFNVDAMLETGNAGQLESWFEFYQLEPFGEDYHRTSAAMARLCNTIKDEANKFIPGRSLKDEDLMKDDFLVPKFRKKPPTKQDRLTTTVKTWEAMEAI